MSAPAPVRGLNPSKRMVQSAVLGRILRNARRSSDTFRALCLPGESGWDVEYLRRYGAKVVALERNSAVADSLRNRYFGPGVDVIEGHSSSYFLRDPDPFDLIYLDYYTNFSSVLRADVKMIFRRGWLKLNGKLVVSFYASRENPADSAEQLMHYEDLCAWMGEEPESNPSRMRLRQLAYHGLIANIRCLPVRPLPRGHPERRYIGTTAPAWWGYESHVEGTHMLVAQEDQRRHRLAEYRKHVSAGGKPTDFQHYKYLRNAGLVTPQRCVRGKRMIEYNGRLLCLADWAREMGVHVTTLRNRLARGWSVERTLTTKVGS